MPNVQSARPIAVKKGKTHHAGKKEPLVGLAAAAACCVVGGVGGGLPNTTSHPGRGRPDPDNRYAPGHRGVFQE